MWLFSVWVDSPPTIHNAYEVSTEKDKELRTAEEAFARVCEQEWEDGHMKAPRKGSKFRAYIWRNSEFMGLFEAEAVDMRPVWSTPRKADWRSNV